MGRLKFLKMKPESGEQKQFKKYRKMAWASLKGLTTLQTQYTGKEPCEGTSAIILRLLNEGRCCTRIQAGNR